MVACAGYSQRLLAQALSLPVLASGQKSAASASVGGLRSWGPQRHLRIGCDEGPSRTVRSEGERCRGVTLGRGRKIHRSSCSFNGLQAQFRMIGDGLRVLRGAGSRANSGGVNSATSCGLLLNSYLFHAPFERVPVQSRQNGGGIRWSAHPSIRKRRSRVLVAAQGAVTKSAGTGDFSEVDGETVDTSDSRGGLLNDAGQASVSGQVEASRGQDAQVEKEGARRSRWVANDGRVRAPSRSKSTAERHLEVRRHLAMILTGFVKLGCSYDAQSCRNPVAWKLNWGC